MTSPVASLALPGTYHAYLVRLWQEHPLGPWRASLVSVPTGASTHFADVEHLCTFLQGHTTPTPPHNDGPSADRDAAH